MTSGPPTVALARAGEEAERATELAASLEREQLRVQTVSGGGAREDLDRCDVLYVIAAAGRISVELSLIAGIAHGLEKPIFISEPTEDEALDAIASGVVPASELCAAALGLGAAS